MEDTVAKWRFKAWAKLASLPDAVVKGAHWGAAVALVLMAFIVGAEVVLRYIFVKSLPDHDDIIRMLMVFAIFLALAYAQRCGLHLRASFLIDRLPARVGEALAVLNLALGMLFIGLIAYQTLPRAWRSFQMGEHGYGLLSVPFWPAKFVLAIGIVLFCAQYLIDLISAMKRLAIPKTRQKGT